MVRMLIAVACLVLTGSEYRVSIVKMDLDFKVTVVKYPAMEKPDLPVMELIGESWCAPCNASKDALKEAKDLPFRVIHVDASDSLYGKDIPAFRWKTPSGKTYTLTGWYGIGHLLSEFRKYK